MFSPLSLSGRPPPPTVPLGPNETPSVRPEILGLLLPPMALGQMTILYSPVPSLSLLCSSADPTLEMGRR